METKFQTSFIPKQPVTSEAPHHASTASLFFLFAFILFMASLACAGGVFIYGQIIQKNITEGTSQLTLNKNAFDPNTINQITRLNDRINAADYLLKHHKSVSTLFLVLSNATLKNVRFSDFNYAGVDDKITLAMRGQALSYETVALQAKEFTNPNLKNVFRSPLFGDLTLDTTGNVSFSFNTSIDPLLVDYYKLKTEEYSANGIPSKSASAADGNSAPSGANGTNANANERGFVQTSSGPSGSAASGGANANATNGSSAANASQGSGGASAGGSGSSSNTQ
jgi:uncharacterized membrane protein YgcG